jgi:hypothetical protein
MINFPNQIGQPVNYNVAGQFNPLHVYQAMYQLLNLLVQNQNGGYTGQPIGGPVTGQQTFGFGQPLYSQPMFGQPMFGQSGYNNQQYFLPNIGSGFLGVGNMLNSYLGGVPAYGQGWGYTPGIVNEDYLRQFVNSFAQALNSVNTAPQGTPGDPSTAVPAGNTSEKQLSADQTKTGETAPIGGKETTPVTGNAAPIGGPQPADENLPKEGQDDNKAVGNVGKMWDVWFDYEVDGEIKHKDGRPGSKDALLDKAIGGKDNSTGGKEVTKGDPKGGVKTPTKDAPKRKSPIILDLNGDGKPGITGANILGNGKIDGQTVEFDIDPSNNWQYYSENRGKHYEKEVAKGKYGGEGQWIGDVYYFGKKENNKEKTEWLAANSGDGFLVWDVDGDGKITSSKELFGNFCKDGTEKFADGYEKLAHYFDKDGNGIVEGDELKGLQIWMDENGDGITDPGELKSLAEFGITSLDVRNIDYSDYSSSFKFEGDKIPQTTAVTAAPQTDTTTTTTTPTTPLYSQITQPAPIGGPSGVGNNYFISLLQDFFKIMQVLLNGQYAQS